MCADKVGIEAFMAFASIPDLTATFLFKQQSKDVSKGLERKVWNTVSGVKGTILIPIVSMLSVLMEKSASSSSYQHASSCGAHASEAMCND